MAKLPRKTQKVFAAGASNNGQFGSAQTGTKVLSNDIATLQALSAFNTGWLQAVISGERLPTLEEMQALHYITTSQIAYIFQEGIPEYDSGTTYYQNSVVKKTGTYELYGSLIDNNTGNALGSQADTANWKYLGTLGGPAAATNTQSNAGSLSSVFLTPANFGSQQSLGASGYLKLPGGVIIQWGTMTTVSTDSTGTLFSYPITFPNAVAFIGGNARGVAGGAEAIEFTGTAVTTSAGRALSVNGAGSALNSTVNYLLIGY